MWTASLVGYCTVSDEWTRMSARYISVFRLPLVLCAQSSVMESTIKENKSPRARWQAQDICISLFLKTILPSTLNMNETAELDES